MTSRPYRIKAILLDFDGTLVDSGKLFIQCFNQLADRQGFEKLTPENMDYIRRLPVVQRAKALRFPLYKLLFFVPRLKKMYRSASASLQFFEGIPALLDALAAAQYQLAILSSNATSTIRDFLEKERCRHFNYIACSSQVFAKEKLIRTYLKKHALLPQEVVYVGDEARDIAACRKAGVPIIWVSWGYDAPEAIHLQPPDYCAHQPMEVLQLLQHMRPAAG